MAYYRRKTFKKRYKPFTYGRRRGYRPRRPSRPRRLGYRM